MAGTLSRRVLDNRGYRGFVAIYFRLFRLPGGGRWFLVRPVQNVVDDGEWRMLPARNQRGGHCEVAERLPKLARRGGECPHLLKGGAIEGGCLDPAGVLVRLRRPGRDLHARLDPHRDLRPPGVRGAEPDCGAAGRFVGYFGGVVGGGPRPGPALALRPSAASAAAGSAVSGVVQGATQAVQGTVASGTAGCQPAPASQTPRTALRPRPPVPAARLPPPRTPPHPRPAPRPRRPPRPRPRRPGPGPGRRPRPRRSVSSPRRPSLRPHRPAPDRHPR